MGNITQTLWHPPGPAVPPADPIDERSPSDEEIAVAIREEEPQARRQAWRELARLLWALAYVPVLLLYIVRSNLDVAYRVIHPRMPITNTTRATGIL